MKTRRIASLLSAAALVLCAGSSPATAVTDEEAFNAKVGKVAFQLPDSITKEDLKRMLKKGKALCSCLADNRRAGVVISNADSNLAPKINCAVPLYTVSGDVSSVLLCGDDWIPVTK